MTPTPRKRQVKGSDKAHSITLPFKVNKLQYDLINDVRPPTMPMSEWLRTAVISAAYHERRRILAEAATGGVTMQDLTCDPNG